MRDFKIGGVQQSYRIDSKVKGKTVDDSSAPEPKEVPPKLATDLVTFAAPQTPIQEKSRTTQPASITVEKATPAFDPHGPLVSFADELPTASSAKGDDRFQLGVESLGMLAPGPGIQQPQQSKGGVRDTFYHHIDWSGFSGKKPLEAGLDVIKGSRLNAARGRFTIDTWHGGLHGPPKPGQVTLVFAPEMKAQQRATDIHQRTTGSGLNLTTDPHLEGVLYNGKEIPEELQSAISQLNEDRQACGHEPVDLLPWKTFENAWHNS